MEWKDKALNYLIENGPKLLGAFAIIVIGLIAARWLGGLMMRWLSRRELEPPVRMLITRVGKLIVVGLAAVIALGTIGFNIMALVTGIGVAGVGLSLAMQGVLGNLVAGLLIIFTKPFRVGQYVAMVGVEGTVETIELFNTTLVHADRSRVIIPNRKITGEILHNYGTIRQLDLTVSVAYDTDLALATAIVNGVLLANPRVLKDPPPVVGVTMLADSSVTLAVRPWVNVPDFRPAGPELYRALLEKFRESRIAIPFPQREIRLLTGDHPEAAGA